MSNRRDRHGRGIRGPLAMASPLSRRRAQPPHPTNRLDFFADAVQASVDKIGRQCPEALRGITVGVQDVPQFDVAWSRDQVPLAAALEGTVDRPGQVGTPARRVAHAAADRVVASLHRAVVVPPALFARRGGVAGVGRVRHDQWCRSGPGRWLHRGVSDTCGARVTPGAAMTVCDLSIMTASRSDR